MVLLAGMGANEGLERLEGDARYLLPGIPNDITLDHVAPKLSWKDFYWLASLSRAWHHAIRSRLVYNARVLSFNTETLVLVSHPHSRTTFQISLYSMIDNSFHRLPPIPYRKYGGIPRRCQFVPLDGKLYVMGGEDQSDTYPPTDKVYMLDVAGQGQWQQCASMNEPRKGFGCGVAGGKIYVFGSTSGLPFGLEVYDPKENTWSLIMPMTSWPHEQRVVTAGAELLLSSRRGICSNYIDWVKQLQTWISGESEDLKDRVRSGSWEANLRDVALIGFVKVSFMAKGKIYSMSVHDIQVYNEETNSWIYLYSCTFPGMGPVDSCSVEPFAVLAIDDELLALVHWLDRDNTKNRYHLIRSRGFGSNCKDMVWQRAQCSPLISVPGNNGGYFLYPIKL